MKAIVVSDAKARLDDVVLADLPIPEPGPGQLRLKVIAVSINPVDWKLALDHKPEWIYPHVLGLDAAGLIDAIGPGVEGWTVGERVVVHNNLWKSGVFAEYCLAPAHATSRLPEGISFTDAAAVPCAGYTAYQALFRKARIEAGQTVLVQGANGGVGGFATQLAHQAGAKVIALTRAEHFDAVRAFGADVVFDYRDPDLLQKVKAETEGGYGVDVMVEVANPGDARKSLAFVHYNGHLVSVDPLPVMTDVPSYTYAASIHEIGLGGAYNAGHVPTQRDFARMGDDLMARLAAGKLDPMVEEIVTLEDIPDALQRLRARAVTGKIVARVAPDA
ncbi:zinc-binding dehydrogenase [Shinella sp.]|uniref:zinc-binding dehydrogenase n=1 Tax=Shinella sp. TaxID=1870904 RepID=UPI0029AEB183|nr:zinc-binding dehydrogenase [Shinella sp.]MDX3974722.1 zinc-binding dehydrogenase [Shinella sp.]